MVGGELPRDVVGRIPYRYFARNPRNGYQVRYCYAVEPNRDGVWLTWEESITPTYFVRDRYDTWKKPEEAKAVQRSRFERRQNEIRAAKKLASTRLGQ